MTRTISMMLAASVVTVAAVAAQTPAAPPEQKMPGAVAVTGCVAPGTGAGQYILTNATTAPVEKDKAPMAKDKMADHTMSYMLIGGDLKPHVGHKVTVTGMLAKSDMTAKEKTEKPAAGQPMMGGTVNVTAVKMVSATCP